MATSDIICVDFKTGETAASPEELRLLQQERRSFKRSSADMGHRGGEMFNLSLRQRLLSELNPPNVIDFVTAQRYGI